MLAIARVLRTGADFLVLDEPTEGLAPVIVAADRRRVLDAIRRRGMTVLLVEQNFRFAAGSRIATMSWRRHDRRYDRRAPTSRESMARLEAYLGRLRERAGDVAQRDSSASFSLGLINGSFYAMLSLGLAIVFGLLGIVNVAQGAFYMLGAFLAWIAAAPLRHRLLAGAGARAAADGRSSASLLERTIICRVYNLDHLYGLLLTLGIFQVMQGFSFIGTAPRACPILSPSALTGGHNLGFMFLPNYRAWVVVASLAICFGTWYAIEQHAARRLSARRDRESDAGARLRHQRARCW